ncbi:MAG: ATP-dependent helicase C-terminal domain-containing protein, partial [Pseudomonadota bacterium]
SGGKGAKLTADDALAGEAFLAVADLDGDAREAAIRLAAPITRAEVEEIFADRIADETTCVWSRRNRRVEARRRRMLGAFALEDDPWRAAPPEATAAAMAAGVRDLGLSALPWSDAARRLTARVNWARARGVEAPDLGEATLTETLEIWLAPHMAEMSTAEHLARLDLTAILTAHVGWSAMRAVDAAAPQTYLTPAGSACRIDYGGERPSVDVRLQELFGLDAHPTVAGEPLTLTLLSPARRPVQTTADLPGFWRSSYADVRKDMRGRYPKHPWPEDPRAAPPTTRAKPR